MARVCLHLQAACTVEETVLRLHGGGTGASTASTTALPETIDKAKAQELTGSDFVEADFDAEARDGVVTRDAFLKAVQKRVCACVTSPDPCLCPAMRHLMLSRRSQSTLSFASRHQSVEDLERYTQPASIWAALDTGCVRLVRLSWLVAHWKAGKVLPRRQELPEEAFIPLAELKQMSGRVGRTGGSRAPHEPMGSHHVALAVPTGTRRSVEPEWKAPPWVSCSLRRHAPCVLAEQAHHPHQVAKVRAERVWEPRAVRRAHVARRTPRLSCSCPCGCGWVCMHVSRREGRHA